MPSTYDIDPTIWRFGRAAVLIVVTMLVAIACSATASERTAVVADEALAPTGGPDPVVLASLDEPTVAPDAADAGDPEEQTEATEEADTPPTPVQVSAPPAGCAEVAAAFEAVLVLDYLDSPIHPVARSLAFEHIDTTVTAAIATAGDSPVAADLGEFLGALHGLFGSIVAGDPDAELFAGETVGWLVRFEDHLINTCGFDADAVEGDAEAVAADFAATAAASVEGAASSA